MIQKHISTKNTKGTIELNKSSLADIADLIRLSPTSCRVLLLFMAYMDDSNSVITDVNTITKMIGVDRKLVEHAIRNLVKNGYVEMKEVKLCHNNNMIGVVHDKKLYSKTRKRVWKVVGEKLVTTFKLRGTYNRFYVNNYIAKCRNNQKNNFIKHIDGNLFYDKRILNNEIIWEM